MKLKKNILISVFALGASLIFGTSPVFAADSGVVNGDDVNVRASNSLDSAILGKFSNGEKLTILSAEGDWFKIDSQATGVAFISRQFVKVLSVDGVVNGNDVNFRKGASSSSEILDKLSSGAAVTVNAVNGEFYSVNYKGTAGYIHRDFISGQNLAYVTQEAQTSGVLSATATIGNYAIVESDNGLKIRKAASIDSDVLGVAPYKYYIDLVEKGTEWHKVKYNGMEGFVSAEFTTLFTGEKPQASRGTEVVAFAKQFLGTPYRWAGTDLRKGVDCSGFVYSVMKNFGINLNRSSRDMVRNGTPLQKSELQAGDLVFFDTTGGNNGQISHVGIYIGNGDFIHSSSSSTYAVMISNLSEAYYIRTYVSACRVLN